jgi:hypothetical protein
VSEVFMGTADSSPRRRWTARELVLLTLSTMLILSPLGALAYALLQPGITIAQEAPDLTVSKVATSLGGIDIANIAQMPSTLRCWIAFLERSRR